MILGLTESFIVAAAGIVGAGVGWSRLLVWKLAYVTVH